jgi:hypothetical protein
MIKNWFIFVFLLLILIEPFTLLASDDIGFRFVRVKYEDYGRERWGGGFGRRGRGRGGFRRGAWATDYPTSDYNLHEAIEKTTEITLTGEPLVYSFLDSAIFQYPVVYLTEPGYWKTNPEEIINIRKYLDRGGFLIIDDFHDYSGFGEQWYNMYDNMKQVFPEREPIPLKEDHPIWSIYFDIDPIEAASTKPDFGRYDDVYFAIYDDEGRMVCVICYNQDISDGWEHPFGRRVLAEASTVSFQMGINFIIYALTH